MNEILLDTSIIIDFLRRLDREKSLLYKVADKKLSIPMIVYVELYAGRKIWEEEMARIALEEVLSKITIVALEPKVSQLAGKIKAFNHNVSLVDAIIAATAISKELSLATLNTKDFEKIEGISLLKLKS